MRTNEHAARQVAALLAGLVLGSVLVSYGAAHRSLAGIPAAAQLAGREQFAPEPAWADLVMRRMSLEEKVGQLFVSVAYGERADVPDQRNRAEFGVDTAADLVGRYHLGGVILFNWTSTLASPRQVAELCNGLQEAARRSGAGVPLLLSTDQENGAIVRIGPPVTLLPTAGALGAAGSADDARTAAEISGRELRAMGINQDLAPVADVNLNPSNPVLGERTFSADPSVAATMTGAQVTGYQRSVAATAKHFPGHGATATDSHVGLPVVRHDRAQWERLDAPPFRAAVAAGVDVIMLGHLAAPGLDPSGQPATLSPVIVDGLLRRDLGYHGVVMTDSLRMKGVRDVASDERIPVLALAAGADLLLMPADLDLAYRSVLAAVHNGELPQARIDASVRRILELKWRRGLVDDPLVDLDELSRVVGSPENRDLTRRLTLATGGRR
jgi:beta-N-acetylhexosaminidase